MAYGFDIDIEGLEELERDLTYVIKKFPAHAEETLKKLAKDFKKSAKKRTDSAVKHTKRTGDAVKKAINKKWGHKIKGDGLARAALVWNSAPHFHLVENGHQLVKDGKVINFVEGKHMMEKTRDEYEGIVPERFKKMVDDILKESDL